MRKNKWLLDMYRFPGFYPKATLRGIFGKQKQGLFNLYDAQKNNMWKLWDSMPELLRPQEESGSGFALWGYGYLLGSRSAKGLLSDVRQGEARITGMAIGEPFLYQAVSFLYRQGL